MSTNGWLQLALYLTVLLLLVKPLGIYMGGRVRGTRRCDASAATARAWTVSPVLHRAQNADELEAVRGRDATVQRPGHPGGSMRCKRLQGALPWNPQHFVPFRPDSAFNQRR